MKPISFRISPASILATASSRQLLIWRKDITIAYRTELKDTQQPKARRPAGPERVGDFRLAALASLRLSRQFARPAGCDSNIQQAPLLPR